MLNQWFQRLIIIPVVWLIVTELSARVRATETSIPGEPVAGGIYELKFPEIGPTLFTLATGDEQICTLMYRLPDNYEAGKQYPVFVFLTGGNGGGMKSSGLERARRITEGQDYIAVSLPLFRKGADLDEDELFGGVLIGMDDFETISSAYRKMLTRFFKVVPSAGKTGNVMGGFSNGAHTTAVLVSGLDETILRHFQHFLLVDGGIWLSNLQRKKLSSCRFLGLYGDTDNYWTRPVIIQQFKNMKAIADAVKRDFELIVMKGIGHQFPPAYDKEVKEWIFRSGPTVENAEANQ